VHLRPVDLAWYPPSCPHYANDEFVEAEDWTIYYDKYGRTQVHGDDWEKVLSNEIRIYGGRREHLTH
jgi:hypothetical protein